MQHRFDHWRRSGGNGNEGPDSGTIEAPLRQYLLPQAVHHGLSRWARPHGFWRRRACLGGLSAFDGPWDRAKAGGTPLSGEVGRGEALFHGTAGCTACHSGPNLSDYRLQAFAASAKDRGAIRATGSSEGDMTAIRAFLDQLADRAITTDARFGLPRPSCSARFQAITCRSGRRSP